MISRSSAAYSSMIRRSSARKCAGRFVPRAVTGRKFQTNTDAIKANTRKDLLDCFTIPFLSLLED